MSWDTLGGCMGARADEGMERETTSGSDSHSEENLMHIQSRECEYGNACHIQSGQSELNSSLGNASDQVLRGVDFCVSSR